MNRRQGRTRLGAVLLLAVLALAAVHLIAPHSAVPSHCIACQALRSQATDVAFEWPVHPAPRVTVLDGERADRPSSPPLRLLRSLRAPPVQA